MFVAAALPADHVSCPAACLDSAMMMLADNAVTLLFKAFFCFFVEHVKGTVWGLLKVMDGWCMSRPDCQR